MHISENVVFVTTCTFALVPVNNTRQKLTILFQAITQYQRYLTIARLVKFSSGVFKCKGCHPAKHYPVSYYNTTLFFIKTPLLLSIV